MAPHPSPTIGLVLGAGGVTGAAYLAGALAALEHDLGWDPRRADVIVGTSAGALLGALLRRGVPARDFAAWTVGFRLSADGAPVLGGLPHPQLDPVRLRQFLRLPRIPRPSALWSALRNPRRFDPLRALLTHLHDGPRDIRPNLEFLGEPWPRAPFSCCAVRRSDGRRHVFGGASTPGTGLAAAVAASCAVPGYFAPVEVDGDAYIDGGVASTTNADVLPGVDVAIVLVPMSSSVPSTHLSIDHLVRARARRQVRDELAPLAGRGATTVTFAPGPRTLAYIGHDFMSDALAPEIVGTAFLETGDQLRESVLARLFDRGHPRVA